MTLFGNIVSSALMVLVSEFGDKTFFVAAILSASSMNEPSIVFLACWLSLALMTTISSGFGVIVKILNSFISFIPAYFSNVVSALLLSSFGAEMLMEGLSGSDKDALGETEQEAEEQIKSSNWNEGSVKARIKSFLIRVSKVLKVEVETEVVYFFLKTFVTNILAEMGDKSQFTTVAVSSASNSVLGVIIGGVIGHAICTGIAVAFGATVLKMIPKQHFDISGALFFFLFAARSLAAAF